MLDYAVARSRLQAILAQRPERGALAVTQLADPADRAAAYGAQETAVAMFDAHRLRRTMAAAAIHRLDDGTYETCLGCAGQIGEARLTSVPETVFCCECQKALEPRRR